MRTKKCLQTLERRIAHLEKRIAEAEKKGRDLSFDKQEKAALETAIDLIEEYEGLEEVDDEEDCLGDHVFGRNWRENIALTEEEREMLSH